MTMVRGVPSGDLRGFHGTREDKVEELEQQEQSQRKYTKTGTISWVSDQERSDRVGQDRTGN